MSLCYTDSTKTKYWYQKISTNEFSSAYSILHREDGPAVEYTNGDKQWYLNGKPHRADGPAIEFADGYQEWYYHGKQIDCKDNQEFLRMIKLMAFL